VHVAFAFLISYLWHSWIQGHPEYGFNFKALVCHDGVFDATYNCYSTDGLFFVSGHVTNLPGYPNCLTADKVQLRMGWPSLGEGSEGAPLQVQPDQLHNKVVDAADIVCIGAFHALKQCAYIRSP